LGPLEPFDQRAAIDLLFAALLEIDAAALARHAQDRTHPAPCQILAPLEPLDHLVALRKAHGNRIAVLILGPQLIDLLVEDPIFGQRMRTGEAGLIGVEAAISRVHLPQRTLIENGLSELANGLR